MATSAMRLVAFCIALSIVISAVQHDVSAQNADGGSSGPAVSNKLDIVFLLHTSNSMNRQKFELYKSFMKGLLEYADLDGGNVRVAVANYARRGRTLFDFNKYRTKRGLFSAIEGIRLRRSRKGSLASGLSTVSAQLLKSGSGDRPEVPNMIFIITDANSQLDMRQLQSAAARVKQTGSRVFTIGLGVKSVRELETVASSPDDVYTASDVAQLSGLKDEVVYRLPSLQAQNDDVSDSRQSRKGDLIIAYHLNSRTKNFWITRLLRGFLTNLVSKAEVDNGNVRIGLVNIAKRTRDVVHLKSLSSLKAVNGAIKRISKRSRSKISNGAGMVKFVRENMFTAANGDRPDVDNYLVILTDGPDTGSAPAYLNDATKLKNAGTKIITVGVWKAVQSQLAKIASDPASTNAIAAKTYKVLAAGATVNSVKATMGFLQDAPPKPKETTTTTTTTLPPPLSDCILARADLIIVVDSSTSVTEYNFQKVLNFVQEFIRKADIDSGNVRVGFVTYSTKVNVQFNLNDYKSKADILAAVARTRFTPGQTNTAGALDTVRNKMFSPDKGDRASIENVVVILTDGVSTVNSRRTIPNARKVHNDGILVYSIGVGLADTRELDGIASSPASVNSFKVANFDELQEVDEIIYALTCPKIFTMPTPKTTTTTTTTTTTPTTTTTTPTTTTTTTTPTTTTTTPTTTTTTPPTTTTTTTTRKPRPTPRITTPKTTTTTRPTTTTTTTTTSTTPRRIPKFSPTGTDVILMLDRTVTNQQFDWMKQFVLDFASQADVDSGKWRIGAMTFDDGYPRGSFQLNDFNFGDEVQGGIRKLRNQPSSRSPKIGQAFDYVRRNMFTTRNGDRPRARNYIIMLTGKENSYNKPEAYGAATRLKDVGTGIYTIGLNVRDTSELDEISSKPLPNHEYIVNSMAELGEVPGIVLYNMGNAPPPTTRPTTTTTTTTTTPRPTIPYTGTCKSKGDVIFLLDTSGSVGQSSFNLMKDFVKTIIGNLEVDNGFFRIGLATFSDSSRIEFMLNDYTTSQDLINAVNRLTYIYGSTNTAEALRRVRTDMFSTMNGDRLDVPNMVIVVSDGHSNINHIETLPEARRIKAMGTTIMSVGIGVSANSELRGMASPPVSENFISVQDFEGLLAVTNSIVAPLCTDDDLCSRNPCQNEGVCVDGLRSYVCVCQPGFYGNNCEKVCGPPADVVLILDSSSSVGPVNFAEIKSYAQRLVTEMEVLTCNVNVGVVKYSSAAMIQFNLGVFSTEAEINRAIGEISYTRGRSNMAEAIRVVRTTMFNGYNGDRYDARNIAYLLTDGTTEINREGTQTEAELMIDAGTRLIPIAVGLRDRRELDFIVDAQGITLMEVENENNLMAMKDQVLEAIHDPNNRCNPNPCENGGTCVNELTRYRCECRAGFTGDDCQKKCHGQADIVFVIDSSRYNSGREFRAIKRFVRGVVRRMAFRGNNFRVGIVSYGAAPRVRLSLMEGDKKKAVKSVISSLRRVHGDPNPEQAMTLVNYDIMNKPGDRETAANFVVFITRRVGSHATVDAINKLKTSGAKIIGLGVKLSSNEQNLLEASVSSPVDKSLYLANHIDDLKPMSKNFVQFLCEDTNKCVENPCQNNGVCVNGGKSYACQCPRGFAGKNCERSCDDRADVVFILDSSGSVGFDNFRRLKEYVSYLVDNMNIGSEATRVGVITYSDRSRSNIFLNTYHDKRRLQGAISGIAYEYGNTNTAEALNMARSGLFVTSRGDRPDVPNFIIIITDGESNVNSQRTVPEAEAARKEGIHIFGVGVNLVNTGELEGIVTQPASVNMFQIVNYEKIMDTSNTLLERTCRDTSVCMENPCMNGGVCRPEVGGFSCKCDYGFQGERCEMKCAEEKDIAIILDSSASVGATNFQSMLEFVQALIKKLSSNGMRHRFSLITYNTGVRTIFSFNRYGRTVDIIRAVQTTPYSTGSTNTAGALRMAHRLFARGYGNRPSAGDMAILVTDGQSNINFWDTEPAAQALKDSNVRVMGIGIALTRTEEINKIASSSSDVFSINSFDELTNLLPNIVSETCKANLD